MRISAKGQVTIPKAIRDKAGFHPGCEVEIVLIDGVVTILLIPPRDERRY